jgi:hypothetical protein
MSDSDNDSENNTYEYVYLIQPKYLSGTDVYKYGKTNSIHDHFEDYPNGSALYYCVRVIDCARVEYQIGEKFSKHFTNHKTGNKYYSGNVIEMIKKIEKVIGKLKLKYVKEEPEDFTQMMKRFYGKNLINRLDHKKKNASQFKFLCDDCKANIT